MSWLSRIGNVFRRASLQRDVERELTFHIRERADMLIAAGMSEEAAFRQARKQFGRIESQAELTVNVHVAQWLEAVIRNLRLAARVLAKTPGFSVTVIMVLALGIGANSTVFSAINAILLQPLPFPNGERIVRVSEVRAGAGQTNISPPRLADWDRLNSTFEAISGFITSDIVDTTGEFPERRRQAAVTPGFMTIWGVSPSLGRMFTDDEHSFGGPSVTLIGERLWRTRGADEAVIDQTLTSAGTSFTIVGIMPPDLPTLEDVDVWSPFPIDAPFTQSRQPAWLNGLGRLKRGVTIAEARADLERVQLLLAEEFPETDRQIGIHIEPLGESLVGGVRSSIWMLFGAVSLLLLITATNIAALSLTRAARNTQEQSIRRSLGASRAALLGQSLAESVLLVLAGSALGLIVTAVASRAFQILAPQLPRVDEIALNGRVAIYTIGVATVLVLLSGILPALRSTQLRSSDVRSISTRSTRKLSFQWTLVGAQVSLSVILLTSAGLLVRSIQERSEVDPGFDSSNLLAFHLSGNLGEAGGNDGLARRINRTLDELENLPGVEVASTALALPGLGGQQQQQFGLVDGQLPTGVEMIADSRVVSPGYFETMRISVQDGEICDRNENPDVMPEAMVNQSFARRYFADRSIIGTELTGGPSIVRVVGVVADARERGLEREPAPSVYSCFHGFSASPWFLVRIAGDLSTMARPIRAMLGQLEPLRPVYDIASLEERIEGSYVASRLRTILLVSFAVSALLLACIGLYGTLSYTLKLRSAEIALRIALGATSFNVVRRYVVRTLRVVGFACAAGLAVSFLFTRMLSGMLYGVTPFDPKTLLGVVLTVVIVTLVAAFFPSVRASRIDPMHAFRTE